MTAGSWPLRQTFLLFFLLTIITMKDYQKEFIEFAIKNKVRV
jgi:hypothetical protein